MLMRTGQLVPCIGHRPDPRQPRTVVYDGQRRLLAARASVQLAGTTGYEDLAPVKSLIVLLLDHKPGADEIRRIQAQANQRESLSLVDQQEQLRDCWEARAGLPEPDRIAAVCADLGISPKRAHNLRRQLALPDPIRARVAERPAGEQISVTMANRLADMHEIAPQLTEAVANRITSTDLHDKALQDMGAFVHRTVVEDERSYAVRIDDGSMLDAAEQIAHAREHLSADGHRQIATILGCELERLDAELDTLAAGAKSRALKLRISSDVRDRAHNGRYAFVHERGRDFAAGIVLAVLAPLPTLLFATPFFWWAGRLWVPRQRPGWAVVTRMRRSGRSAPALTCNASAGLRSRWRHFSRCLVDRLRGCGMDRDELPSVHGL